MLKCVRVRRLLQEECKPILGNHPPLHACSHVGNFGDLETFSFHATKLFNSCEGGGIATNDDALAQNCRLARNFGVSECCMLTADDAVSVMTHLQAASPPPRHLRSLPPPLYSLRRCLLLQGSSGLTSVMHSASTARCPRCVRRWV